MGDFKAQVLPLLVQEKNLLEAPAGDPDTPIKISIECGPRTVEFEVFLDECVARILVKACRTFEREPDSSVVTFAGEKLHPLSTMRDAGVQESGTITIGPTSGASYMDGARIQ